MPTLPGKRKKLFITSAALATILAFSNAAAFGAMGGSKGSNAPCITKGNATAQYNSLKSANKQNYCVALTSKLQLVITTNYLNWDEAQIDAQARGGNLTGIFSQAEQDQLDTALIANNYYENVWLSGYDSTGNGTWVWKDSGVQFGSGFKDQGNYFTSSGKFANWESNDPNNQGSENCVVAVGWHLYGNTPSTADSQWVNYPCYYIYSTYAYLMRTN